jgi:hypothetical protein
MNYPSGFVFEVQKYGTTLEWSSKITEADSAFNQASPGGVAMYKIDLGTSKKTELKRR